MKYTYQNIFSEKHSESSVLISSEALFLQCYCCPQSWKMKSFHPKAKEASSWTIIHLWIWLGVIYVLQCPSGLSSTSVSLPTHYMQVLDNTWVPYNVQMVNFPLSRQFCHSYMKFRPKLLKKATKPTKEVGTELIFILKCTAPITSKVLHER